jgi:hypothetical protein
VFAGLKAGQEPDEVPMVSAIFQAALLYLVDFLDIRSRARYFCYHLYRLAILNIIL